MEHPSTAPSAARHAAPRLDDPRIAPAAHRAQLGVERHVRDSGLEASLVALVEAQASLTNGRASCVERREPPCFTPRERAALAWAEAVADVAHSDVPGDVYAEARAHFDEGELVALTMVVVAVHGWNRLAASLRPPAGGYVPPTPAEM